MQTATGQTDRQTALAQDIFDLNPVLGFSSAIDVGSLSLPSPVFFLSKQGGRTVVFCKHATVWCLLVG